MELDWIEDFLVLADGGIFAKSAQRRNVTQPAFTRRIRKLEYAMGATLFDRSVHPVALTPAGQEFRQTALEVSRLLSVARTRLRTLDGGNEAVSIASLQALASSFLPRLLGELGPLPGPIKVTPDDFAGCVEALLTGAADILLSYSHPLIVTAELDDRFLSSHIDADQMVAVCGKAADGAPLFSLSAASVPYLRYSDESFLGKVTRQITAAAGLDERLMPRYQNSMADGLKAAARVGLGVAWLPLRLAEEDILAGRLLRISGPAEEGRIDITMFRNRVVKSRLSDRLWSKIEKRNPQGAPPPA